MTDMFKNIDFGWWLYILLFMLPLILLVCTGFFTVFGVISFDVQTGVVPLPVLGMLFGMLMNVIGFGSLCEGEKIVYFGTAMSVVSFIGIIIL
jgi:hypothetical protein